MFLQTVASSISSEAFVLGMSAVGAGLAVQVSVQESGKVTQLVKRQQQ